VPEHLGLADFWQSRRFFPAHFLGNGAENVSNFRTKLYFNFWNQDASLTSPAQFVDNWFIPPGLVKSSEKGFAIGFSFLRYVSHHDPDTSPRISTS
jgi:hypothetical protein